MMRALPLIIIALATSPAAADPVKLTERGGSPAVEADGNSSTTISVLGGAASVTVEASGSLNVYSNSGTVTGRGSLGVPQLGLTLGLEGTGEGEAGPDEGPVAGRDIATSSAAGSDDACHVAPRDNAGVDEIAGFDDAASIGIAVACSPLDVAPADIRAAIADNDALSGVLATRGYGADDVRAVDLSGGVMTLFVGTPG